MNIKYDEIFYTTYYSVHKSGLNIGNTFKSWVIGQKKKLYRAIKNR